MQRLVVGWVMLGLLLTSCSTGTVITKEDMQAAERAKQEEAAQQEAAKQREEAEPTHAWNGPVAVLGQEVRLFGTDPVLIEGSDVFLQLVKTSWSTIETPSGAEERRGTAKLLLTKGEEMKQMQVDEGEKGMGFGYELAVSSAYEAWNDEDAEYFPEAKVVVTRQ